MVMEPYKNPFAYDTGANPESIAAVTLSNGQNDLVTSNYNSNAISVIPVSQPTWQSAAYTMEGRDATKSLLIFAGINAEGESDLWLTNGTASGTYEIKGIEGGYPAGLSPKGL